MGQTLEALHDLQVIELKLVEMRREREAKVRRVQVHQRQSQVVEGKLKENKAMILDRQMKLDALQLDVAAREEMVNNHRQALNKAKTNKEYAAILTAMNTEKADNSKVENDILQLMEDVQTLTDKAVELEAEREGSVEQVARAEGILGTYDGETESRRVDLQSKRDQCSELLEPTILATFNRVAARNDGEAMASVVRLHPKRDEHVCSGCNMKVTLESVNSLQSRDEIQVCRVCGRIHFLEAVATHRSKG